METSNLQTNGNFKTTSNDPSDSKKTIRIIVLVSLALIATLWTWKSIEIDRLNEEADNREQHLKQSFKIQLIEVHDEQLKLLIKPVIWAIRTEMNQGDLNQINLYLKDLIKDRDFQRIAVANERGIIISSTNKKEEGMPLSMANISLSALNETRVTNIGDSILNFTSPIMGLNSRLGILTMTYKIPTMRY